MNEIELWESEIAESNRFHFFEDATKAVDFLYESIEMDYKLLELGILTEADEEDDEENDRFGEAISKRLAMSQPASNLKDKIAQFFQKICRTVAKLVLKIAEFIREKINKIKQNNIIKKFENGKYDIEKLADKLNKTQLFDPRLLYEKFKKACFHDKYTDVYLKNMKSSRDSNVLAKASAEMAELESLLATSKHSKVEDSEGNEARISVHIDPKNAKHDIVALFDETKEYLEKTNDKLKIFENDTKKKADEVKSIENKDELRTAKGILAIYKATFNCSQKLSKILLHQLNTLANIINAAGGVKPEDYDWDDDEMTSWDDFDKD